MNKVKLFTFIRWYVCFVLVMALTGIGMTQAIAAPEESANESDIRVEQSTDELTEGNSTESDTTNLETETTPIQDGTSIEAVPEIETEAVSRLTYQTHVSDIGWQGWQNENATAGTNGQSRKVEALQIKSNIQNLGVSYSSYNTKTGWQTAVTDNAVSGTVGKATGISAIRVNLTGNQSSNYDVYYRVHLSNYGWLGWVKNGSTAGDIQTGMLIEAVQIATVAKGTAFETGGAGAVDVTVSYTSHVKDYGWMDTVSNGETGGTTGKAKWMEAIKIDAQTSDDVKLGLTYNAHVKNIGWQGWKSNGEFAGTTGQSLQMEAIQIKLTGVDAEKYDVYYRAHTANFGWLGWAKNGTIAGSSGYSYELEAVEVIILPKNATFSAPAESMASVQTTVNYQTHVQDYGWMSSVKNGAKAGTTGQAKKVEAIKIDAKDNNTAIGLSYQTHLADVGWQGWKSNGEISGTTGQNRQVEAIQIKLTGNDAAKYDVYYRTHVQNYGWLGWAANGETAGTYGCAYRVEAIEIKILPKGVGGAPTTGDASRTTHVKAPETSTKVAKGDTGIDVSYWNGYTNNWTSAKNAGVKFTILRTSYGYPGEGGADSTFEGNYKNARAAGIPVGVYHYSEASNTSQALAEANYVLSILNGRTLDLPVVIDMEDPSVESLSKETLTNITTTFCERIKQAGYTPMVYANLSWLNNKLDYGSIQKYKIWLAQYNDTPSFTKPFDIWQYSSKGIVNGIGGSAVDMNKAYTPFY